MRTANKCLTCRQRVAYLRGCCMACYQRHHRDVKADQTTWEVLVANGLALPATKKKPMMLPRR